MMSTSSRVMSRVLRGEAGRLAMAETFGHHPTDGGRAPAPVDPFAAERSASYQQGYEAGLAEAAQSQEAARAAAGVAPV